MQNRQVLPLGTCYANFIHIFYMEVRLLIRRLMYFTCICSNRHSQAFKKLGDLVIERSDPIRRYPKFKLARHVQFSINIQKGFRLHVSGRAKRLAGKIYKKKNEFRLFLVLQIFKNCQYHVICFSSSSKKVQY